MKNSLLAIFVILLLTSPVLGQEKHRLSVRDTLDNAFDISQYLYGITGFLPVVAPITEPAVGYGAAGSLLYFVPTRAYDSAMFSMPDMAGLLGGYTQNNTWIAGGMYFGFWNNDKIRYQGVAIYSDANLKYYGSGGILPGNQAINFNIHAFILRQQAIWRLGNSHFFLGANYQLSKTTVKTADGINIPGINQLDYKLLASGVTLIGEYEDLNSLLSPTKGVIIHTEYLQNLELLGSDRNYGVVSLWSYLYFPVSEKWVPALRIENNFATGNAPFYSNPFISLRGVPALRYQGKITALIETEHLFNISRRWGLVGFAGTGIAFNSFDTISTKSQVAWNAGAGFRYLIARLLGLRMGMDFARGPEQWAFYVVFGKSWR